MRSGVFGVARTFRWGEGTRRSFTARMKVQRVRTRPDASCCELIDVVQATEYRVCDDLSVALRRRPSFLWIARCPLSDRSMRPPMIEVRSVRG
jgi:hypothetical protein